MVNKAAINSLLVRVAKDDDKALEKLFKMIYPYVEKIVTLTLKDQRDKEDVISEALLKIYQKAYTFSKKMDGFAWIVQIVRNQVTDYNRWYKRKQKLIEIELPFYLGLEGIDSSSKYSNLRIALRELDQKEYEIIRLKFWQRYTLKDIAEKQGTSLAKAFRIYTSALDKLKKMLK